jgi:hypothetical protein
MLSPWIALVLSLDVDGFGGFGGDGFGFGGDG